MSLYQVRTVITGQPGSPYYNNLYWDVPGVADGGEADTCVSRVHTLWSTLAGVMAPGITINVQAEVLTIDPASGEATAANNVNTPATIAGGGNGSFAAGQVQGLIAFTTGQFNGGRRASGRLFVPGVSITRDANGAPDATWLQNANQAAVTYITVGEGAGNPAPAIYSRKNGTVSDITGATASTMWATLRSRGMRGA
jgi:hypothetical protein